MDLNYIARGATSAVLPMVPLIVRRSAGQGQDANFKPVALYEPDERVLGNIQSTTWRDLQQLDAVNQQGTRFKAYLEGNVEAIVRMTEKGGDLIIDPRSNEVWLTAQVLERFPDWCCVAITLQNGS